MSDGMLAEALEQTIQSAREARDDLRTYIDRYIVRVTQEAAGYAHMARLNLVLASDPKMSLAERLDAAQVAYNGYRDAMGALQ